LNTNTDKMTGTVAREKWHSTKSPDLWGSAQKYVDLKYKRPKKRGKEHYVSL